MTTSTTAEAPPRRRRTSKTITISLPPEMAAKAEALAAKENRTMSELFREALRNYLAGDVLRTFADIRAYGATRNLHGYTEEDVPRLIKEVRTEMAAKETAIGTARAS